MAFLDFLRQNNELNNTSSATHDGVANEKLDKLISLMRHLDQKRNNASPPPQQILAFNQFNRDMWVASMANLIPAGSKVLDVGAGTCPYRHLFQHCQYKTADFKQYEGLNNPERREGLYGQIDYVCDITSIPVDDAVFDCVISTEVIEHVPEPIKAVGEMARVLRSSGKLILTAPLGSGLHQEPFHYYGGYTPYWYRYVAGRFGLEVIEIIPNRGSFSHIAQECCRVSWWMDRHRHIHGEHSDAIDDLFGTLLPRLLTELDDAVPDPQFTIGFHVLMQKI